MSENDEWAEGLEEAMQVADAADIGDETAVIDLNTATAEDLQQLPGIGPALATRIVDYRTEAGGFQEPSDVVAVPGVSEAMYAGIAGRLTTSPVESVAADAGMDETEVVEDAAVGDEDEPAEAGATEDEAAAESEEVEDAAEEDEVAAVIEEADALEDEMAAEAGESDVGEDMAAGDGEDDVAEAEAAEAEVTETEAEQEPDEFVAAIPAPLPPEPAYAPPPRQPGHWGRLILTGLLSITLGALLVLLVLYAVNGTLDFRTASSRELQREAFRLDGEIGALDTDLTQVQDRLGVMEDLAARLNNVETDLAWLQEDVSDLQVAAASLAEGLSGLQEGQAELAEHQRELGEALLGVEERLGATEEQLAEQQQMVAELAENVAALNEEMESLRLSAERFDAFLEGLRHMLNESMGAPTRTPWVSETPVPQVTIVPLATPTPTK